MRTANMILDVMFPPKYVFNVRDNDSGATCIVGPCTTEEMHELLERWAPSEGNDSSPFDDRWGFAPVGCTS